MAETTATKRLVIDSQKTHLHDCTVEHFDWFRSLEEIQDDRGFTILEKQIPAYLGSLDDGLHLNVPEDEVFYKVRGNRSCASRLCKREPKQTQNIVIIYGPADENGERMLYTAYGSQNGCAPREPGDTSIESWEGVQESREFWKNAALSD